MSMFSVNPAFHSVTFDREELEAISVACVAVAAREQALVADKAEADLDEYAEQVKKIDAVVLAGNLASLFKPGQEILIEREDLEPLAAVIRMSCTARSGEKESQVLRRALEKVEACLADEAGACPASGAGKPQPRRR